MRRQAASLQNARRPEGSSYSDVAMRVSSPSAVRSFNRAWCRRLLKRRLADVHYLGRFARRQPLDVAQHESGSVHGREIGDRMVERAEQLPLFSLLGRTLAFRSRQFQALLVDRDAHTPAGALFERPVGLVDILAVK
jgi:hypothetical protein